MQGSYESVIVSMFNVSFIILLIFLHTVSSSLLVYIYIYIYIHIYIYMMQLTNNLSNNKPGKAVRNRIYVTIEQMSSISNLKVI